MFFGAVENFRRALLEMRPAPRQLIIRLNRVPFMDITGIQTLEDTAGKLRKRGALVVLCEANARVHQKLKTAGVLEGDVYCSSLHEALLRGSGSSLSASERPTGP
jgi:SulP family sulfate permease